MKTRVINVFDVKDVKVPDPVSMTELRELVSDQEDLFYLAHRGFDQVRRTHLTALRKRGMSTKFVRDAARAYHYHRQSRT